MSSLIVGRAGQSSISAPRQWQPPSSHLGTNLLDSTFPVVFGSISSNIRSSSITVTGNKLGIVAVIARMFMVALFFPVSNYVVVVLFERFVQILTTAKNIFYYRKNGVPNFDSVVMLLIILCVIGQVRAVRAVVRLLLRAHWDENGELSVAVIF